MGTATPKSLWITVLGYTNVFAKCKTKNQIDRKISFAKWSKKWWILERRRTQNFQNVQQRPRNIRPHQTKLHWELQKAETVNTKNIITNNERNSSKNFFFNNFQFFYGLCKSRHNRRNIFINNYISYTHISSVKNLFPHCTQTTISIRKQPFHRQKQHYKITQPQQTATKRGDKSAAQSGSDDQNMFDDD